MIVNYLSFPGKKWYNRTSIVLREKEDVANENVEIAGGIPVYEQGDVGVFASGSV